MAEPIRIANCSGFYGDRLEAAREMVDGGPIDVLAGDYLAELTMAILARQRMRDHSPGYVPTFLSQLEQVLGRCVDRGIKIVANAGGLDPPALGTAVSELASRLGVEVTVGVVDGDDVLGDVRSGALDLPHAATGLLPVDAGVDLITANAYLGGWGIASALDRGADVVVTGRVSDASLAVGPAAHHHGWRRDDWDRLAGAVVAGHVIECGTQATGGNFSFFEEIPGLERLGFPIAEIAADGSSVITKHPGTGGKVTVETVTAQLLYEIGGARYLNPDVIARFDTISLEQEAWDRVRVRGVVGEPPPPTTKVAATGLGGYRNSVTFLLAGLDIEAKARAVESALWRATGGRDRFDATEVRLMRTDQRDPGSNEASIAHLQVTVTDADRTVVGRAFSSAAVELALASYPGFVTAAPPAAERPLVRYWPSTVAQRPSRVIVDGLDLREAPAAGDSALNEFVEVVQEQGSGAWRDLPTVEAPIGRLVGARSGDKGGDANLGVFARSGEAYEWLSGFLTAECLRAMIPEARGLTIDRQPFPGLHAINFVLRGLLGEGVSSSTRWDPQAKSLGEYFRSRVVPIPEVLLAS